MNPPNLIEAMARAMSQGSWRDAPNSAEYERLNNSWQRQAELAYQALHSAGYAVVPAALPTKEMVCAWSNAFPWQDHPAETYLNPGRYRAMIQAALAETAGGAK